MTSLDQPQSLANNVLLSIQVSLAPDSSAKSRIEATQYFNNFMQNTPPGDMCAVAFSLTTHNDPTVIRTGLQVIEHVAKYNWQNIQEREIVKERLLLLMRSGFPSLTMPPLSYPLYLQEGLAKTIVEIAKREWPQLWPNLFPMLFECAGSSDLALMVLRRMVEDVATLQTVDSHERRRELSVSLTAISSEVISTIFGVLVDSVKGYKENRLEEFRRRAKVCLGCLLPYIESTNPQMFLQGRSLEILFALLVESDFKLEAVECICQLLERKAVKKEDRFDIPNQCLESLCLAPLLQSVETSTDEDFLRRAGETVAALAPNVPANKESAEKFLSVCEKLASRRKMVTVFGGMVAVNAFLRALEKEESLALSLDTYLNGFLVKFLGIILQQTMNFPDSEKAKRESYKQKSEMSLLLRSIGSRLVLYTEVRGWLLSCLQESTANPTSSHQWDILTLAVEASVSSCKMMDPPTVAFGLGDLNFTLQKFESELCLEKKSFILSVISALFGFLDLSNWRKEFTSEHLDLQLRIINAILRCFDIDERLNPREIKRHCSSLMIKLATKYPSLMLNGFDVVHKFLLVKSGMLTTMERNNLIESLVITSNAWNDFGRQSEFISQLIVYEDWKLVEQLVETPEQFIPTLQESVFAERKNFLLRNILIFSSVLRKVSGRASHPNACQVNGTSSDASSSVFHPAYEHIRSLFPTVFKMAKVIHSIVTSPEFAFVMELSENEKSCVIGLFMMSDHAESSSSSLDKVKSFPEHVKTFLLNLQDITYSILGESCIVFGRKYYSIPQLGDAYLSYVGYNTQHFNDYRLRNVVRTVFRPFLLSCPYDMCDMVMIPFCQKFFPFMLERLRLQWAMVENLKNVESEGQEEKEVVENCSLRVLTKDYVEILVRLLEKSEDSDSSSPVANQDFPKDMELMMDSEMEMSSATNNSRTGGLLGDFGKKLLADDVCFTSVLHFVVSSLCWEDSNVCLKSARCIVLIWEKIVSLADVVRGIFGTALRAVCLWADFEANLDALLKIIDVCFLTFESDPFIMQMLQEWGAPEADLQKLVGLCRAAKSEKKRKDVYRRLVNSNPALERNKCPKSQWLKGLPQLKLNEGKLKSMKSSSAEIDLTECFSLIHNRG